VDECEKGISQRVSGGYASAGFAEVCEDATAIKPWSFTFKGGTAS